MGFRSILNILKLKYGRFYTFLLSEQETRRDTILTFNFYNHFENIFKSLTESVGV